MSNLGSLGWVSDRAGYRYQPTHPETGKPWPPIPESILAIWRAVAGYLQDPEACLVNYYRQGARMGLHRDEDEEDFSAPASRFRWAIPPSSASADQSERAQDRDLQARLR